MKGANGQSCIATLVERVSRLVLLVRLRNASSGEVCKAIIQRLGQLPAAMRQSLTYDRGTEMAQHGSLTEQLQMPVYFCKAYSPWQRGSNENTNGLIRQYLPKGLDLSSISERQLQHIEFALNNRPRRILGYRTNQADFDAMILRHGGAALLDG